jgi:hypothetical protein
VSHMWRHRKSCLLRGPRATALWSAKGTLHSEYSMPIVSDWRQASARLG